MPLRSEVYAALAEQKYELPVYPLVVSMTRATSST